MGLGPSKEKIKKILERSCNDNKNLSEQTKLKIEYCKSLITNETTMTSGDSSFSSQNDSMDSDTSRSLGETSSYIDVTSVEGQNITARSSAVSRSKEFPYIGVGTIIASFSHSENKSIKTCFIIDSNVIVTLESNIKKISKGDAANHIITSFNDKVIKNENIFYFDKDYEKVTKTKLPPDYSGFKNLAVILYDDNISDEWIGIEGLKEEEISNKDLYLMCSLGIKNPKNKETDDDKEQKNNQTICDIHEMNVQISTVFQKIEKDDDDEEKRKEKDLLKHCKGGPVYYKDYNGGAYVIGILNRDYKINPFTRENMIFLVNMVNKGKLLRKKVHKGIDEEHIVKLDLSRNDFGPLDVKYLTDFDLKNLRILDLSSNSIKPQGAFYLSQGKYPALESLNLNFNEIGDEGLNHIANGFFNKLTSLFLFHNNISYNGIASLCKADFIRNLMILSLSENPNITDDGVRIIKEAKNWTRLNTLNLNSTGLTDAAVNYLTNSSMPKLRKLSLIGNKFTNGIEPSISALKLNRVKVEYLSPEEKRKRAKKKKQQQQNNTEQQNLITNNNNNNNGN